MYGYGNVYNNNTQMSIDRINNQIKDLENMRNHLQNVPQPQTQPAINQTFQLAPQNNSGIKVVNSVDDVQRELAITDTPFVNNNYTTLWIKNAKGEIRTFELKEIKPKDEKDLIIEDLKSQIYQLNSQIKEMNTYEQQHNETSDGYESKQLDEPIKNEKPSNVSNAKSSKPKSR